MEERQARRRVGRAGLGILGAALAFALAAPPVGLWPVAPLVPASLTWALWRLPLRDRVLAGLSAGALAALLTVVAPLAGALADFFSVGIVPASLAATAIGVGFGGGGFAIIGGLAGDPAEGRPLLAAARLAAAWVLGDLARSVAFTGLPWLLLPHLLAPAPGLIALAPWIGIPGTTLWLAGLGAAGSLALLHRGRLRREAFAVAGGLGLVALGAAMLAPGLAPGEPGAVMAATAGSQVPHGALRVGLVQPAAPAAWRHELARVPDTLRRLRETSEETGPVDLLVWPENAIPVLLPANAGLVSEALGQLSSPPAHLLVGAPRSVAGGTRNAALLFDRQGRFLAAHDKVHRVPFSEYLPELLAGFWEGRGAVAGVEAGLAPVALLLDGATLGPLICYEMLFAGLARSQVRAGADLLVNLSHDGYFGGEAGARQHLTAAILRAAELGRPVLRATSDGFTVAIDARGRIQARLPARQPGVLVVDVWPRSSATPALGVGNGLAIAAALAIVLMGIRQRT